MLRSYVRTWLVLVLVALGGLPGRAWADPCIPLLYHGPSSGKLDVVFIAQHQYPATGPGSKFAQDVDLFVQTFTGYPQIAQEIERFNFWRLDAIAADDSCEEYVYNPICWDMNKVRAIASQCTGFDPANNDQIAVMFNADSATYYYARGDHSWPAVFMPSDGVVAFLHEFGHSFANLGEEYDSPYPATVDPEYPNNASLTPGYTCENKWGDLIGTNGVGCFQNAGATNWYRPTLNDCRMRTTLVDHYCVVCWRVMTRQLSIYAPGVTSVDDRPRPGVVLHPLSPNPFTEAATIRIETPAATPIVLAVYDVRGERRAVLFDGQVEAGSRTFAWDGRDASGARLRSGVYFLRCRAAGASTTEKLVLLR